MRPCWKNKQLNVREVQLLKWKTVNVKVGKIPWEPKKTQKVERTQRASDEHVFSLPVAQPNGQNKDVHLKKTHLLGSSSYAPPLCLMPSRLPEPRTARVFVAQNLSAGGDDGKPRWRRTGPSTGLRTSEVGSKATNGSPFWGRRELVCDIGFVSHFKRLKLGVHLDTKGF